MLGILAEARRDVEGVAAWYENEQAGLGARFLCELDGVLKRIEASPGRFPTVDEGVRRAILRRFPFGIYFQERDGETVVLAVLHFSRQPGIWQDRLQG
ncbi:MAG: type II toxin-antitoxin system RelE/ParE family toxin [Planctomycetota bacterium]